MNVVGFIFARGGSKGILNKNIKPLKDKPLIHYAIESALASKHIDTVVISTDSPQIAECAKEAGAQVPFMRPDELAQDNTPEWKAWQHAIEEMKNHPHLPYPDVFVCVPTTAPLRDPSDLDRAIDLLLSSDADLVISVTPTNHHPSFNMVRVDPDGTVGVAMPLQGEVHRRQEVPFKIFNITTVAYVTRPSYIQQANGLFDGKVNAVEIPPERAVDIDTPIDFEFAEFLLEKRLRGQE